MREEFWKVYETGLAVVAGKELPEVKWDWDSHGYLNWMDRQMVKESI